MKEFDLARDEVESLAAHLADTFVNRWDLYARQLDDGSYVCIHEPLGNKHLIAHLKGEITLGTYLLDIKSLARFVVFDADDDGQMEKLIIAATGLEHQGIPCYIEGSRRGGHLWLFFEQPVSGEDARAFGQGILAAYNLTDVELYPKQDQLKNGPGSLMRLPFGVHRMSGLRYEFITPEGQPLAASLEDQIQILGAPKTISGAAVKSFGANIQMEPAKSQKLKGEKPMNSLSQRIKDGMTAYDFIGEHVQLSASGRGLCPFHDDNRSSFSVNIEENYWHCFAGCGGGSIIDFWMRWQECDFTSAISELAQMLLNWNEKEEVVINNIPSDRLLKASEVAGILNVSKSLVYQLMRQRELQTVKIGAARRVRPKDLKAFIEDNSSNPVTKEILE